MNWKKIINESILARILILMCIIKMGTTLKCFVCDTELNSACNDITKKTKLKPQECTMDGLNNPLNTLLGGMNFIRVESGLTSQYGDALEENQTQDFIKYECIKIISTEATGRQSLYRSCQIKQVDHKKYCQIVQNKAWEKSQSTERKIKIVHCELCDDKDNCNGTSSNQFSFILIVGSLIIVSVFF